MNEGGHNGTAIRMPDGSTVVLEEWAHTSFHDECAVRLPPRSEQPLRWRRAWSPKKSAKQQRKFDRWEKDSRQSMRGAMRRLEDELCAPR